MELETGLDDTNQTTFYIPHREADRDPPNGYELRLAAYRTAWFKCLERIQQLIRALHAPVVGRVVDLVNGAYTNTLPGLPYTELPVISVTGKGEQRRIITYLLKLSASGTSTSIFDEISSRLETEGQDGLFNDTHGAHIVTHIFPSDCPNTTSAMKTLITGFINKTDEELGMCAHLKAGPHLILSLDSLKRKPTTSLSIIDINLLQVWFDALCAARVILHAFEQFEPLVVQDLFEICSLAIPRLPLVFVLSLTSPPSPSYIHATYRRSTLSRLQVGYVPRFDGALTFELFNQTFFDIQFDPYLMLGPTAIDFLADFFGRHTTSLDGLMSVLQSSSSMNASITQRDRLMNVTKNSLSLFGLPERPSRNVRSHYESHFNFFLLVQRFMISLGHKDDKTLPELMCAALRGRLGNSHKYLCTMVKKLRADQLDELLSDLRDFFTGIPNEVREAEKVVISRIDAAYSVFSRTHDEPKELKDISESLGEWLSEYFQQRLVSLEESPLCDIWYTGSTPFPSEFSPGYCIPQDYIMTTIRNGDDGDNNDDNDDEALLDMPDTSIIFHRYLETGKMINVYDWFESFTIVLDAQKRRVRTRKLSEDAVARTPSRRRRGKQRQREQEEDYPEESEEDLEKWKLEVQARFIRSLHELDYIGLIKHTGRKPDHVMRTVFDVFG
ncbi:hypothetical protein BU15DRAFT_62764 [Melanogaster broomeanus]|nr:hypothetical protein BU15DRAFT_62764 [Melanogaster broomeanus]